MSVALAWFQIPLCLVFFKILYCSLYTWMFLASQRTSCTSFVPPEWSGVSALQKWELEKGL